MIPHDDRPSPARVGRGRVVGMSILGLFAIGAAMVATSAIIHLYLWGKEDGYRDVPTVGPMFLAQGVVGCVLAAAAIIKRHFIVALAGAVFMAGSIAALYKSIHGGLFDFDETSDAPYVQLSFVVEFIGLAAFAGALVLLVSRESKAYSSRT